MIPENFNLKKHLARIEIEIILRALEDAKGVTAKAARMLGVKRTTLMAKLCKYKLHTYGN